MKAKPDNNTDGPKTGKGRDANGKFIKGNSVGKPFKKGDPRINSKGRPKVFDDLRKLSQQIANEVAIHPQDDRFGNKKGDPVVINGHKVTLAEAILRKWSRSNDARLQMRFVEVAYGKVPDFVDEYYESKPSRIVFVYE